MLDAVFVWLFGGGVVVDVIDLWAQLTYWWASRQRDVDVHKLGRCRQSAVRSFTSAGANIYYDDLYIKLNLASIDFAHLRLYGVAE